VSADADNDVAKTAGSASDVAATRRTDAVTGGIVRTGECAAEGSEPGGRYGKLEGGARPKRGGTVGPQGEAEAASAKGATALQAASSLFRVTAETAGDGTDDDDADLGEDAVEEPAQRTAGAARRAWRRKRTDAAEGAGETQKSSAAKRAAASNVSGSARQAGKAEQAQKAKRRMQSRRTWLKARETAAAKGAAEETAKAAAVRKGTARAIASAASSAAVPVAGVVLGVLAVVLAALLASQLASSLFGFWENEASQGTGTLAGVEQQIAAALKGYGFTDEATAAVLGNLKAESAMDPASDEVMDGMFNHAYERACGIFQYTSTRPGEGEYWEYKTWCRGQGRTWSDLQCQLEWTFSGNCPGTWSGRWGTNLASRGYYSNCPGYQGGGYYATPDEFKAADDVDKAAYSWMACYEKPANGNLAHLDRRIEYAREYLAALRSTGAGGNAIVAAAESQLGVPYVWGGSTPGVGLDCSGLVQYCYAQAGIQLPHYSESQMQGGTRIPLSEAQPGDILWKPGHVAIYVGGDEYIHEPQTGDVCKRSTGISYFTCAVRY
jgi:hypothetical protein